MTAYTKQTSSFVRKIIRIDYTAGFRRRNADSKERWCCGKKIHKRIFRRSHGRGRGTLDV